MTDRKVTARFIKKDSAIESKRLDDPFIQYFGADDVLTPKYDPNILNQFVEESNILPQCIEAYKRKIGTNWKLNKADGFEEKDLESAEALEEKKKADLLFDYSGENSLMKNLIKVLEDRERSGNGFLEVIRNPAGEIAGFAHVPHASVRYLKPSSVVHSREINTPYGPKKITQNRKFYRFAQIGSLNQKVYFKEFGDPRELSYLSGKYGSFRFEEQATEIIPFKIETPGTPYGIPRYMGNLLSILGSRRAELINYYYFDNGRHTPMAIIVEGGVLSDEAMNNVKDYLNEAKGVENAHKVLLLEAAPEEDDQKVLRDDKKNQVKVRFEPLTKILQKDALFVEYDEKNRKKIRSSFQLPPILTGETEDYTRATARESEKVAEKNVFRPLRRELEEQLNQVFSEMGIRFWKFSLEDTDVKDREEISNSLKPFISQMTINQIQNVLPDLLPGILPQQFEEDWADVPLALLGINTPVEKTDKETEIKDTLTNILRRMRNDEHKNRTL